MAFYNDGGPDYRWSPSQQRYVHDDYAYKGQSSRNSSSNGKRPDLQAEFYPAQTYPSEVERVDRVVRSPYNWHIARFACLTAVCCNFLGLGWLAMAYSLFAYSDHRTGHAIARTNKMRCALGWAVVSFVLFILVVLGFLIWYFVFTAVFAASFRNVVLV